MCLERAAIHIWLAYAVDNKTLSLLWEQVSIWINRAACDSLSILAGGEQYAHILIETREQNTENHLKGHNNQLEEDGTMGKRGTKRSPRLEKATKPKKSQIPILQMRKHCGSEATARVK
jgi:hypothetical protein